MPALPSLPAIEATWSMRPYFWATMCGSTCFDSMKAPRRLMPSTRSKSAGSTSCALMLVLPVMPAQLTSPSMRPSDFAIASSAGPMARSSVMSSRPADARPPPALIFSAAACAVAPSLSRQPTATPLRGEQVGGGAPDATARTDNDDGVVRIVEVVHDDLFLLSMRSRCLLHVPKYRNEVWYCALSGPTLQFG